MDGEVAVAKISAPVSVAVDHLHALCPVGSLRKELRFLASDTSVEEII